MTTQRAAFDVRPFTSRWVVDWVNDRPDERHLRLEPAALLFLDISGFTAMSEMLASLGRIGSEEVREVINRTFTELLDLAYSRGASLLKFGGDALLLLFVGDDAHLVATATAWDLRGALHAANPVTTAAGQLDLDVTIGVHAGPVDLFLVGDSHRELIVAGPTATRTIEVEGAADKGQVLVSEDLAERLPEGHVHLDEVGRRVLTARPDHPVQAAATAAVQDLPRSFRVLSNPVHDFVTQDQSSSHRHATIAFVHFSGTDALAKSEGPAALAQALHQLMTILQKACDHAQVCLLASDVDADGGKLILTAGVPSGGVDDDERMLRACRDIIEAKTRLAIQIGVNRGPIFSGVVGPPHRLTYTVLGDAVNLAARIMSRAEHGQLLAESEVVNRSRTLYDTELLPPFHVKGKSAPVRAVALGPEVGVRVRMRQDDGTLVGRDEVVEELVGRADREVGHAVTLVGPAGIGKSRLIDELQDRRPRIPFHLTACSRFGADRPYRAVAMLLRLVLTGERHGPPADLVAAARQVAAGEELLEPWLPLLADVVGVDIPDTAQTRSLSAAFRAEQTRRTVALLLASALWGRAVLVIEDVQWLDPESRELLVEIQRHVLSDRPWLLVFTTREAAGAVDGSDVLEIGPLADADARQLVLTAVDRGEAGIDLADAIIERGAGNPLFLRELIRASGEGALPDSLEGLFQSQLDQLAPAHRHLLEHAAVLGLEFPPELLEAVSRQDEQVSLELIDELGEFLATMRTGYLRFTQSLVQEVAYASLPFRKRQQLHRTAARALEAEQQEGSLVSIEALSRHHHLAGEFERSWRSSRQAYAEARGRSAVETAARFARRALEAGRRSNAPGKAMARVWEGLGDMLELSGAYKEAEDAFLAARRHAQAKDEPRLCRRIALLKERQGDFPQALRWFTKAMRASDRTGQDVERIEAGIRRAVTLMRQGRRAEGLAQARSVAASVDRLRPVDEAYLLWVEGFKLVEEQDSREARRVLTRSAELFGQVGDRQLQANALSALGAALYYAGDWEGAVNHYRMARDLWHDAGDRGNEAGANANLGELLGDQGHFHDAVRLLRGADDFARAARNQSLHMATSLFLSRNEARLGDDEGARGHLEDARLTAKQLGAAGIEVDALHRLAECALFARRLDLVDAHLRAADDMRGMHPGLETWGARLRGCAAALAAKPTAGDLLREAHRLAIDLVLPFDELLAAAALTHHGFADLQSDVDRLTTSLGIDCPVMVLVEGPEHARR